MKTLYGKTLEELGEVCNELSLAKYTAKQMADWLYNKQVSTIADMTNLSLKARETLSNHYRVGVEKPLTSLTSKDGTRKYVFKYGEDVFVEAVVIFDKARVTLCISSQAGCKLNCAFCATGQSGFKRNLSSGEILNAFRSIDEHNSLTNIVFMGMGEPLDNWFAVYKSIQILTSQWGYALSPRRITVSTCGILPKMKSLLEDTNCNVAISLHSSDSEQRKRIMPVEKSYSIADVVRFVKKYNWLGQRRLTFEYIVFEGFNNSNKDVAALCLLLKGLNCRLNLISYHCTNKSFALKGANHDSMTRFRDSLTAKGLMTTIRASKGEDILAACGLLSGQQSGKR
ncbi:MAG: 23S rRNA (adenine(2503)-C(2))-methyltransferase RlmN [Bacteroidales bacterium]|jgi:23S rRNA (adenine2503-C2)-methyltransferase|nr:23S rRNA (adenine(2503)-C(2))-methyltransferase RlmN [Bacteroidales bacterium]